ncbi:MAG: CHASE2 domain-containing protein, partial [Thermodesulfobacteriota bacterium]
MKIKKDTITNLLVAFIIFLAVSVALCFISFNNDNPLGRLLREIDLRYGDERFEYRNDRGKSPRPPDDLAILAIDEKSVNELGRWPWSRKVFADFINKLSEYQPKVVAFDIVNSEYSNEFDDNSLAEAVKNLTNPVLGYFFRDTESTELNQEAYKQIKKSKINIVKQLEEPESKYARNYQLYKSVELNIPEIGKSAKGFGFFNFQPDSDGIFRRAILTTKYDGGFFPSLSLEAFRQFVRGQIIISLDRFGIHNLYVNKSEIPVSENGQLILNFYGETGAIPTYSIVDVLNGEVETQKLRDKIVLIGATEIAIYDIRPSPLDNIFPGIELQATAVANILTENYLLKNNYTQSIDLILITAYSFILILLLFVVKRTITGVFILTSLILIHIYSNYYVFEQFNFLLSGIFPILSLVLSFVFYEGYRNLVVEKRSRFLKRAFSSYVAPDIVNQIISNPDRLHLGGENRVVTLLFSDIRGFTSLSEKTSPSQLVEILNNYLNPMTRIVMENKGTLDKFIGDAVMAIYGAPFDLPMHGKYACETAVKMMKKLEELNRFFAEKQLPEISIGIGINTGEAVVGNMGADI